MGLFQLLILQIHLHGIGIGNGVAQRGAGGKNCPPSSIRRLDMPHLVHQIQALVRAFGVDTVEVFQLGSDGDVLVVVGFIHENGVELQIIEGDILRLRLCHAFQKILCQLQDMLLFPFNAAAVRLPVAPIGPQICHCFIESAQLTVHVAQNHGTVQWDHFKTAVRHDHTVIISVPDLGQYLFPHGRLEGFWLNGKDLCLWVQIGKYLLPLSHNVVRHHKQVLAGDALCTHFHGSCNHNEGLARTHIKGQ